MKFSLSGLLKYIQNEYPQDYISLPYYDYYKKEFVSQSGPKYLYRCENDLYPETKSYYQRLLCFNLNYKSPNFH